MLSLALSPGSTENGANEDFVLAEGLRKSWAVPCSVVVNNAFVSRVRLVRECSNASGDREGLTRHKSRVPWTYGDAIAVADILFRDIAAECDAKQIATPIASHL